MSMWRTVYRLEWRILRRDNASMGLLGLFAGLLVLAAFAGGQHADRLEAGLERAQQAELSRLAMVRSDLGTLTASDAPLRGEDPRDPVWMGEEGAARLAVLPPAPLASVAVGQRDLYAQAVHVGSGVQLTTQRETETAMSGPTRLQTGAFDPGFLFVVLFPLVVIALSYEILSGERERGTLAMLLSQPVSQTGLVLGKATARATALCVVTLGFAGLGLVVAGVDFTAAGVWSHVALYALVLVAWALFWFAAAVAVNAWGEGSARNALWLVGLWLVLVVIVPGLVRVAVDAVHPPPSQMEMVHEARDAAQDAEKELAGLQGKHDVDPRSEGFATRVVAVQEQLAQRAAPVLEARREALAERQSLMDVLRFLSPAMMTQQALEALAGAGAHRHQRFDGQVDAFHDAHRAFYAEAVRGEKPFTVASLDAAPGFAYEEAPMATLLGRVLGGLLGLLTLVGLLMAVAWPGLKRVGRLTR